MMHLELEFSQLDVQGVLTKQCIATSLMSFCCSSIVAVCTSRNFACGEACGHSKLQTIGRPRVVVLPQQLSGSLFGLSSFA